MTFSAIIRTLLCTYIFLTVTFHNTSIHAQKDDIDCIETTDGNCLPTVTNISSSGTLKLVKVDPSSCFSDPAFECSLGGFTATVTGTNVTLTPLNVSDEDCPSVIGIVTALKNAKGKFEGLVVAFEAVGISDGIISTKIGECDAQYIVEQGDFLGVGEYSGPLVELDVNDDSDDDGGNNTSTGSTTSTGSGLKSAGLGLFATSSLLLYL